MAPLRPTSPRCFGKGDIDTTGYGFGGTADLVRRERLLRRQPGAVTWYDSDLKSVDTPRHRSPTAMTASAMRFSIEDRQAICSDRPMVADAAGAARLFRRCDFDSFTDAFGADVSLGDGDSLTGRLGISARF